MSAYRMSVRRVPSATFMEGRWGVADLAYGGPGLRVLVLVGRDEELAQNLGGFGLRPRGHHFSEVVALLR
ncbi:hypothetical protein GCM10022222_85650 [Amycolatopsis ultiminotia]|uniref:Uncharacterized protein n=1 Tax=Amycolatopsis ultiminotia TaxID=543629 RepID=A0ABP6YUA2_9PSEU